MRRIAVFSVGRYRHHHHHYYQLPPQFVQTYQRQSLTSSAAATASSDPSSRFRRRFYRIVDIQPVAPPWHSDDNNNNNHHHSSSLSFTDKNHRNEVESPISAGVDGTDSASGVHRPPSARSMENKDAARMIMMERKRLLTPQRLHQLVVPHSGKQPETACDNDNDDDDNNNDSYYYDWYSITLDGRILKTPMGHRLTVPSQHLAQAIAAEWNAQSPHLQVTQMPLMTLTCTALDQAALSPQGLTQYQQTIRQYLATDTVCYFTDPIQDRVLYQRQEHAYRIIHRAVEQLTGVTPGTVMTDGSFSVLQQLPHPPALVQACDTWLRQLDAWHATALHAMVVEAKSFLTGMALLQSLITTKQACAAARVEEEFQIANWGLVEGGHDYDRLNSSVQLHAAMVLKECLAVDGRRRTSDR